MQKIDRTDQEIIGDYLDGDEKSLELLIERYLRPIYNFTYHICNNTEDAEDVTSEVFIKVWKNFKKYRPEQSFKVWIFSIARNTTVDWLRKRKNIAFSDFDTDNGENFIENTAIDNSPLPDELAILSENKIKIQENISNLSPIYQTILVMRYTEDFSFKEIGEILQKPIDTVKSQHRRALIELRKRIKV
jgi:RNA polymerase sigma-70 factor, ECF subfamily